eukprot:jgi/Chlat1/2768/Chrsp187S02943
MSTMSALRADNGLQLQVLLKEAYGSLGQQPWVRALLNRTVLATSVAPITAFLAITLYLREKRKAQMAAGKDKPIVNPWSSRLRTVVVVAALYGGNRLIDKVLKGSFPSALAGMLGLFAALCASQQASPRATAKLLSWTSPGVQFLSQWLPLFFVTPLITLPLAVSGIPSAADAVKLAVIVGSGFVFNLLTTAGIVMGLETPPSEARQGAVVDANMKPSAPAGPGPQFPSILAAATAVSATALLLPVSETPLMFASTVLFYLVGRLPPPSITKVLHPLVTCGVLTSLSAIGLGLVTDNKWSAALRRYKTGNLRKAGAGDILLEALPLGLISLAFSLYNQRKLLQQQALPIVGGTLGGSALSLIFSAFAARVLKLSDKMATVPLPRSVMSALAIPIAQMLRSDVSLSVVGVVLSGLLGANFASTLLTKAGVKGPVARGVAVGACSHGLGTASLVANEPLAASVSAVSLALVGAFTTIIVTIPMFRNGLVALAASPKPGLKRRPVN